ncbi:MAG: tRNA uridine-5-carboxymethylaminomethyl(34) synthesis GTPase MnmE [Pseudomonadota bacterium]
MIKPLLATDTICALASGAPPSAVAIIRISGPATAEWMKAHSHRTKIVPRHATLVDLQDSEGTQIDQALLLWMPGPQSYTGQDVLEIHLHGGQGVVEHALGTLTSWPGIRLAEQGEFTRRAFHSGKLDLTQAEGIADLIESETRAQKDQALRQTEGALSDLYKGWKTKLQNALALLEVSIDFPDESEAPETVSKPVLEILKDLERRFVDALREGEIDQRVRDGFRVAILGEPNAGKSTLLNYFARRPAAIVTDIPGTTRDIVEVRCRLGGHIIWFQDTAGIRETEDAIEQEGINRSRHAAETADLRLFLLPPGSDVPPLPQIKQETDLVVQTKMDLSSKDSLTTSIPAIAAKTGEGCDELEDLVAGCIQEKLGGRTAPVLTRARHRAAIESGLENLRQAQSVLMADLGAELASESLRTAVHSLQSLLGTVDIEDILEDVFSEFCIGK